jgi:hypothetical protein
MPASKALKTSLVCTCSARLTLPGGINDDFICHKVEKKSVPDHCILVSITVNHCHSLQGIPTYAAHGRHLQPMPKGLTDSHLCHGHLMWTEHEYSSQGRWRLPTAIAPTAERDTYTRRSPKKPSCVGSSALSTVPAPRHCWLGKFWRVQGWTWCEFETSRTLLSYHLP